MIIADIVKRVRVVSVICSALLLSLYSPSLATVSEPNWFAVQTDPVSSANELCLRSQLNTCSTNLLDDIRANTPNAFMEEVGGGRKIVPEYLTELPRSLEFAINPQEFGDEVPTGHVHTIRIRHGEIDATGDIADLAGKRLSVTYTDSAAASTAAVSSQAPLTETDVVLSSQPLSTNIEPRQISLPYLLEDDAVMSTNATYGPIDFGFKSPDDTEPTVCGDILTFSNNETISGAVLHITISLINNPSGAFSIASGSGSHNIPIGSSVTVNACFSAVGQSYGTKTAQIKLVYYYSAPGYLDSETTTDYYNLTGKVVRLPDIDGSYGYPFNGAYINHPEEGTCRIMNSGSLNLYITGISLDGTDAALFELVSGTGTYTLAPGGYHDVNVRYLAGSVGNHSARVLVEYTYDGAPRGVYLPLTGVTRSTTLPSVFILLTR